MMRFSVGLLYYYLIGLLVGGVLSNAAPTGIDPFEHLAEEAEDEVEHWTRYLVRQSSPSPDPADESLRHLPIQQQPSHYGEVGSSSSHDAQAPSAGEHMWNAHNAFQHGDFWSSPSFRNHEAWNMANQYSPAQQTEHETGNLYADQTWHDPIRSGSAGTSHGLESFIDMSHHAIENPEQLQPTYMQTAPGGHVSLSHTAHGEGSAHPTDAAAAPPSEVRTLATAEGASPAVGWPIIGRRLFPPKWFVHVGSTKEVEKLTRDWRGVNMFKAVGMYHIDNKVRNKFKEFAETMWNSRISDLKKIRDERTDYYVHFWSRSPWTSSGDRHLKAEIPIPSRPRTLFVWTMHQEHPDTMVFQGSYPISKREWERLGTKVPNRDISVTFYEPPQGPGEPFEELRTEHYPRQAR